MSDIRRAYLDSYRSLRPLAAAPELTTKWDTESVLQDFSVRGLEGRLIVRTGGGETTVIERRRNT